MEKQSEAQQPPGRGDLMSPGLHSDFPKLEVVLLGLICPAVKHSISVFSMEKLYIFLRESFM